MKYSRLTTNDRVTVPTTLRKKYGLAPGCKVKFEIVNEGIKITALVTPDEIKTNIGFLGTKGMLLKTLVEEKKRENKL